MRKNQREMFFGLTFWAPNVNIFRDPRWGRGQETYGEDPFLTGRMAVAFVSGMQGNDPHYFRVVSTPKHFAVHSGPEPLRHSFNVDVSPHDLEDTYMPAFRAAVTEAHAQSVMCAYNAVDGYPACASTELLQDHLRDAWNFDGYVVSDCAAVADIATGHKFAPDFAHASADAVKAGTDVECGYGQGVAFVDLGDAVRQNLISESAIDTAVKRLFRARFKLGMFDPPDSFAYGRLPMTVVNSPEHRKLSLQAAREAIVLLKNEGGFLPLGSDVKKIAVVGPTAELVQALQGNYNGPPPNPAFPLAGIEKRFGKQAQVVYAQGSTLVEGFPVPISRNALHTADGQRVVGDAPSADTRMLTARETMRALGGLHLQTVTAEPVSQALRPLRTASVQLFVLTLVFLAVALPAVVLYARSTTRELRRLTEAARAVRRDDASDFHRVSDTAPREVRVLSGALETMLDRLETSRHELARQESLAAMGMMAAGLAHEIRTPLSIVRGSAEMLGRNAAAGSREEELTTFILGETGRLSRLVNDLLSFARPREPERAPVDLADIVARVVAAIGGEYDANQMDLDTDLAATPVEGDADQLYQVVLNLLANARKASSVGSRVRVRCAVEADTAVLEIRDQGKGIAPEQLADIWTPFFTTGGGGTGLGLPIVRRIVEAHGGTVTIESQPDAGTTATVRLPARSDA
ncbi:MAG: glycoside hydrolase family 3 N-terminal domain-containing protein [Acidobacteriota bacterium]